MALVSDALYLRFLQLAVGEAVHVYVILFRKPKRHAEKRWRFKNIFWKFYCSSSDFTHFISASQPITVSQCRFTMLNIIMSIISVSMSSFFSLLLTAACLFEPIEHLVWACPIRTSSLPTKVSFLSTTVSDQLFVGLTCWSFSSHPVGFLTALNTTSSIMTATVLAFSGVFPGAASCRNGISSFTSRSIRLNRSFSLPHSPARVLRPRLSPDRHSAASRRTPISSAASEDALLNEAPLATPDVSSGEPPSAAWNSYVRISTIFTNLFPIWTLLCALSALKKPALYTWLTTPYFTLSLGLLMLSMGITLSVEDFRRVLRRFGAVALGFVGCYVAMPLLALLLARLFSLPAELAAGVILIGAVNGGQASNLCTYIANGNVALSVLMTTSTTLGAIVMTPLISKILIGTVVPVNAAGIAMSTIQVVLFPIALGMLLNRYANRLVKAVLPFSPVVGVVATCLLVGSAVAQCGPAILQAGISLQIPVMLLHLIGGIVGYIMVALAGYGEIVRRTTAIETAMKSSAFSFLLASLHFSTYLVRVPSAVSIVWMSLVGSSLAVFWRYVPVKSKSKIGDAVTDKEI